MFACRTNDMHSFGLALNSLLGLLTRAVNPLSPWRHGSWRGALQTHGMKLTEAC